MRACLYFVFTQSTGAVEYTDRGVRIPNECPEYDTKLSDGEVPVMKSTPSLPSLPGSLWHLIGSYLWVKWN